MRILAAGDDAVLVECASAAEAVSLHRSLTDRPVPGVGPTVPGARTLLVHHDPARHDRAALAALLAARRAADDAAARAAPGRVLEVPVVYDGEDLGDVAALLGTSVDEVVRRHAAATWTVAFMGFAPGFAYLTGSDPRLVVPRRDTPRTRVPAGSVALAGAYGGVYPREGPGGWQLVGWTGFPLWDLDREPPVAWAPGDQVRFRPVREVAVGPRSAPAPRGGAGRSADEGAGGTSGGMSRGTSGGGAAVEVVDPGVQALVQDAGRPGLADLGVGAAGAADPRSLRAAIRAVGGRPDDAALESHGGLRLRARGRVVVAVAGAAAPVKVRSADGEPRAVAPGRAVLLRDGDELAVGAVARGLSLHVAVRGGVAVPPVLGSRSTDLLGGIGPAPLVAGTVLPVGAAAGDAVALGDVGAPLTGDLPAPGDVVQLPVTLGPRDDWFTADALRLLLAQEWEVTALADRVGTRLHGAVPLERRPEAQGRELASEGVVTGGVQVPPSGQPVLFGPDHPLTGGYPVVAVVTSVGRRLLGQLPTGARLRFVAADRDQSVEEPADVDTRSRQDL
ncbi:KipI family sensor histidine kinase inhibitor [Isoptericola jiangsuensis]|uniref:KipI family sensor histidine kinase inhibitor n=1 Tax=Isoptericola jiangsuensis TaxID=548579 RepID=A0A2A9F0C4_9MICO|nr:carboxyltransferase domain-containing protein [Isoptericola jiangsuensis]PFG44847.1 KipI family sensor histidine kinase inhibitor [Isoptericola jiangsuensis]